MWDWAIWAALIIVVLAGIAALTLFAVRARTAWRDLRETRQATLQRLDEFAGKAEAVAEKLAAEDDTAELRTSLERLRLSLAQLAVLRSALDEVDGTVARVTAYVPHK